MRSTQSFLRGAAEALTVTAIFLLGGLASAAWLSPPGPPLSSPAEPALYLPGVEPDPPTPTLWLVDGYNTIGVGLLAGRSREGWWTSNHRRELLRRASGFEEDGAEIWVVFDGAKPSQDAGAGRVREVFAPDADAWLLRRVEAGAAVVTADRRLAERVRRRGARVVSPGDFLARCHSEA